MVKKSLSQKKIGQKFYVKKNFVNKIFDQNFFVINVMSEKWLKVSKSGRVTSGGGAMSTPPPPRLIDRVKTSCIV